MGILAARREQRRRQSMTNRYLDVLLEEPSAPEVRWLVTAAASTSGSAVTAETTAGVVSELRLLRGVLGLLVAERDALDDQTAADVSHALDEWSEGKQRGSGASGATAETRAQWAVRRREYVGAMASRGGAGSPLARLASVLLQRTGVVRPTPEHAERALELVTAFRHRANQALQEAYGATSLPEDQLPSDVWRERTGQGKAV